MENEAKSKDLLGQDEPDAEMDLDLYEASTYSFVLKIWLDSSATDGQRAEWLGEITEVIDRRRRYFRNLREMINFLGPYLDKLGIEDSLCRPSQNG